MVLTSEGERDPPLGAYPDVVECFGCYPSVVIIYDETDQVPSASSPLKKSYGRNEEEEEEEGIKKEEIDLIILIGTGNFIFSVLQNRFIY